MWETVHHDSLLFPPKALAVFSFIYLRLILELLCQNALLARTKGFFEAKWFSTSGHWCTRMRLHHNDLRWPSASVIVAFQGPVKFSGSVVSDSVISWTVARQASLSITSSQSLLKLMSIKSVMPSNHLILRHPLLLLQSFPASGSFQMSQFFASGGQSIGISASASVLPKTIQVWFPLGRTGWISLQSKGLSRVFSDISLQWALFRPAWWNLGPSTLLPRLGQRMPRGRGRTKVEANPEACRYLMRR